MRRAFRLLAHLCLAVSIVSHYRVSPPFEDLAVPYA